MIVMKFGGTSVESREAIARVAGIVEARIAQRPVVVVSAMGKTTNQLLAIASLAAAGRRQEALDQLAQLREFHRRESWDAEAEIDAHFSELGELVRGLAVMGELTPRATDAISAFGERLSSLIVTAAFCRRGLNAVHLDSRKLIVTDRRHTQAAPASIHGPCAYAPLAPVEASYYRNSQPNTSTYCYVHEPTYKNTDYY